jgi:uncharacterized protein YndB with AHSA1/START domain
LEDVDGGTLIVATTLHDSLDARDQYVASGMEDGMTDSYNRLHELVASLHTT